jgi:hypothetical protein
MKLGEEDENPINQFPDFHGRPIVPINHCMGRLITLRVSHDDCLNDLRGSRAKKRFWWDTMHT